MESRSTAVESLGLLGTIITSAALALTSTHLRFRRSSISERSRCSGSKMAGHTAGLQLAVVCLIAAALGCAAQRPDSAVAASAFCNGTEIRSLRCDWAGDAEQSKTASGTFAGTMWTAEPTPPKEIGGNGNYFQIASKVVSLTVRTVFKFLPGSEGCSRLLLDADTLGSFGRGASPINRCELRLTGPAATAANGTDAAAVQAALAAPDNSCQTCTRCDSCPQAIGVWYSDTASFDYDGCAGLAARPNDGYVPTKPGVVINPRNKVLLAGFTVNQAAA